MVFSDFLTNLLIFWLAIYVIGALVQRILGFRGIKLGLFYLELTSSPDRFNRILAGLSKIIGPLMKVGIVSLLGLSVISALWLIDTTLKTLLGPKIPSIVVVVPGLTVEFSLPILLAIFVALSTHEFGHAAASVYSKVPVKKISIFILFILIGAFVEPDEEYMKRLASIKRLGIYSSGIMMNLLTSLLVLLIALSIFPGFLRSPAGVYVEDVIEGGPSYGILSPGVVIREVGGIEVSDIQTLIEALGKFKPGQEITVVTDKGSFNVKLGSRPDNPEYAWLGVRLSAFPYYKSVIPIPSSLSISLVKTIMFTLLFSIGIAALNSLPILPLDGGLVVSEILTRYLGNEALAKKIAWIISAPFALMLVYNILIFFLS